MKAVLPETCSLVVEWCSYHYGNNLAGIAFFDPTSVDPTYPHGDLNILLVLHNGPDEDRQRYDIKARMLMNTLLPNQEVKCRIQTVEEINQLAALQLPLLAIYLQSSQISFDPWNILQRAQATLRK